MKEIKAKPKETDKTEKSQLDEILELAKQADDKSLVEREEQAIAQAIDKLTKSDSEITKILSEATTKELFILGKMRALNDIIKKETGKGIKSLDAFPLEYLKLKISKNRKGREEIVKIATSRRQETPERFFTFKRFLGDRGMS